MKKNGELASYNCTSSTRFFILHLSSFILFQSPNARLRSSFMRAMCATASHADKI